LSLGILKKLFIFEKKIMAVVYRHIRLDKNEPFYIGIGEKENRAYTKRARNHHWHHIVKNTDYKIQILFDDLTWEKACEKEIELIKIYGRKDLGLGTLVNLTDGGEGQLGKTSWNKGKKTSEETIKKMKSKIVSEETIKKISESHKKNGIKPPSRKGTILSEKTKKKLSEFNKGKIISEQTRNKISESLRGKTVSIETKKKIGEFNKGKFVSEESRKKMSEAHNYQKKIVVIDEITYYSITDAAKHFEVSNKTIVDRIKSKSEKFVNWNYKI
jgi:hypothetical protein